MTAQVTLTETKPDFFVVAVNAKSVRATASVRWDRVKQRERWLATCHGRKGSFAALSAETSDLLKTKIAAFYGAR